MDKPWMIYGANGYTGELVSRSAAALGLNPTLAGRNKEKISRLAKELDLPYQVFPVSQSTDIGHILDPFQLLLNCAGPFIETAPVFISACIQSKTHYLDITGEIDIFELAAGQHGAASTAGIILCPGVGFDVIPTDCLAALLKSTLPEGDHLSLGFSSQSGPSSGTARTALRGLAKGIRIRRDGMLKRVSAGKASRTIDFGRGPKTAMRIPWGDVATAYYSTGIPNVEVYVPVPPDYVKFLAPAVALAPLLRIPPIPALTDYLIRRKISGPSEQQLKTEKTLIWGELTAPDGSRRTARFSTANGYQVTVDGSLSVVGKLLTTSDQSGGYYTPSKLMGKHFVTELPGTTEIELT